MSHWGRDEFADINALRAAMPRGGMPSGNRGTGQAPDEAEVPSAWDIYTDPDPWGGDPDEDAIFSDDTADAADYDATQESD